MAEEKEKEKVVTENPVREGESSQRRFYFGRAFPETWEAGGEIMKPRKASFRKGFQDLVSGRAGALSIANANPAACWLHVTLSNPYDADEGVSVMQTDVNIFTFNQYAASKKWTMSLQDLKQWYKSQLKEYHEYLKYMKTKEKVNTQ